MEPWEGMVSIPEGKAGDYRIEHFTRPAGPVERSNMRTAIIGGQADPPLYFDRPTSWHRLAENGSTWMTDLPIEQAQHDAELAGVTTGRVLVGGLGLGYAANLLAARPGITEVVVIEKSREVVELVADHVRDPRGVVRTVRADLFDYLEIAADFDDDLHLFDHAFYDIWQSDGLGTFFNTVMPLRRLSVKHGMDPRSVICWNENVMVGQLHMGLQSAAMFAMSDPSSMEQFTKTGGPEEFCWRAPFFKAMKEGKVPSLTSPEFHKFVARFVALYRMDLVNHESGPEWAD